MKIRNGLPTKRDLQEEIDNFFINSWKPSITYGYGRIHSRVVWTHKIEEKIVAFIERLEGMGIEIEEYRPYDSPTVGCFVIKKAIRQ